MGGLGTIFLMGFGEATLGLRKIMMEMVGA